MTVAMVSGLGGGIIRDILLGAVPPATFSDGRYLAVAAAGGLAAFALSGQLAGLAALITVLEAAGLGLFAVTGASKAVGLGLGPAPAVILGAVTGVGGGTLQDVLLGQIPSVLRRGLYAIPALTATVITVATAGAGDLRAARRARRRARVLPHPGPRRPLPPERPDAPQPAQRTRRSRRTKAEVPNGVSPKGTRRAAAVRFGNRRGRSNVMNNLNAHERRQGCSAARSPCLQASAGRVAGGRGVGAQNRVTVCGLEVSVGPDRGDR